MVLPTPLPPHHKAYTAPATARMLLAVSCWCSLATWLPCISFSRMLLCTLHGARLAPKQLASPVLRLPSVCLREGHWPPDTESLPGGAGGVALWPSRRLLPGRKGLRTGLTGFNQVPCCHPTVCLPENHAWDLVLVYAAAQGFYQPSRSDKDKWLVCSPGGDHVCGSA